MLNIFEKAKQVHSVLFGMRFAPGMAIQQCVIAEKGPPHMSFSIYGQDFCMTKYMVS